MFVTQRFALIDSRQVAVANLEIKLCQGTREPYFLSGEPTIHHQPTCNRPPRRSLHNLLGVDPGHQITKPPAYLLHVLLPIQSALSLESGGPGLVFEDPLTSELA